MASIQRDVITMLSTGDYCSACTAEKPDTSTKIAGNDNIGNHEDLKGEKCPIRGVQLGGQDIEYEPSPQWEDECPRWTPPTSGYSILNRDRPPTIVRLAQVTTQATHKQVHMKEEPEVSPPKKEPKCSFCGAETHSYQTCPGLRQMVLKQTNELTRQRMAEYEILKRKPLGILSKRNMA